MTIEYEGHSEQNRRKNRKKRRVRTQPIEHDMDRIYSRRWEVDLETLREKYNIPSKIKMRVPKNEKNLSPFPPFKNTVTTRTMFF